MGERREPAAAGSRGGRGEGALRHQIMSWERRGSLPPLDPTVGEEREPAAAESRRGEDAAAAVRNPKCEGERESVEGGMEAEADDASALWRRRRLASAQLREGEREVRDENHKYCFYT